GTDASKASPSYRSTVTGLAAWVLSIAHPAMTSALTRSRKPSTDAGLACTVGASDTFAPGASGTFAAGACGGAAGGPEVSFPQLASVAAVSSKAAPRPRVVAIRWLVM